MQRLLALALVSAFLLIVAPAASTAATPLGTDVGAERAMLKDLSGVRTAHGKRSLIYSDSLSRSARAYAKRMARRGIWRHARSRSVRGFRNVREILARHTDSPSRRGTVIRMWMGSGLHRATLLGGSRWAGVGMVRARVGGRKMTFWVVRFAARR